MADVKELAAQAVQAVRQYVETAFAKAETRIDELAGGLSSLRETVTREIDAVRLIKGEKGDPGRDALELDVLSRIDPSKSYPRGTFATHHGGLVRATRRTDPLGEDLAAAGWAVLVDGVREIKVEPRGERAFAISVAKTSGPVQVVEARMNVVLDRGVWREGHTYERGDGVSFGGSTWIAQTDVPTSKPGTNGDWRLAVKKGRDGKDWRPPA